MLVGRPLGESEPLAESDAAAEAETDAVAFADAGAVALAVSEAESEAEIEAVAVVVGEPALLAVADAEPERESEVVLEKLTCAAARGKVTAAATIRARSVGARARAIARALTGARVVTGNRRNASLCCTDPAGTGAAAGGVHRVRGGWHRPSGVPQACLPGTQLRGPQH